MYKFYQEKLNLNNLEDLKNIYDVLLQEDIKSAEQLERWIAKIGDLDEQMEEILTGHYIDFQCSSNSQEAKEQFTYDQTYIEPLRKSFTAALNKKLLNNSYLSDLPEDKYGKFIKSIKNAQELFREENVQLEIEEDQLVTTYFEITGNLTVIWDEKEISLSELSPYLEDKNRTKREKATILMSEAFLEHADTLQKLMSELIQLRRKKAANANLDNYRDFKFKEYERFDYTPEDCLKLADAVKQHVTPLKEKLQRKHKDEIGVERYRPWDRKAPNPFEKTLTPFSTAEELVHKAAGVFTSLDSGFTDLLNEMNQKNLLDLTARQGKAPGGFCSPLPVTGLSFIFMNAAKTHDDVITLLHEMGHCIHNNLTQHFDLPYYKEAPMESAELASMSMELMTMDYWHYYYEDESALIQAKKDHWKSIIDFLPMGVVIDQFQHWMYENPEHTEAERLDMFLALQKKYDADVVDWEGLEEWRKQNWLRILHIFEVPFYFIEYVIAQLGALQLYKNYKTDAAGTLEKYKEALALGASASLPEVYKTAGISFDFSAEMISSLVQLIEIELEELEQQV